MAKGPAFPFRTLPNEIIAKSPVWRSPDLDGLAEDGGDYKEGTKLGKAVL